MSVLSVVMFSLPVQTMKGTVCFLTFGYYQQQINEICLSKHPVPLANSLYVCTINMTYCERETLRILEQFNYLQQPLLVGDGNSCVQQRSCYVLPSVCPAGGQMIQLIGQRHLKWWQKENVWQYGALDTRKRGRRDWKKLLNKITP